MSENILTPDSIIFGEREYAKVLDLVIAEAQQQLLIFDQDFSHGDYACIQRFNLIHDYLNKSPTNQLTIILQNTDFF